MYFDEHLSSQKRIQKNKTKHNQPAFWNVASCGFILSKRYSSAKRIISKSKEKSLY